MKSSGILLIASLFLLSLGTLSGCASHSATASRSQKGVEIIQTNGALRVEINGALFTVYHFQNVPKPYFYPVLGPDELAMTRKWPLEPSTNEEHDHPHHRGLWYAHSSVNGLDFWTEGKNSCRIVHDKFLQLRSGREEGVIQSSDRWVAHDGSVVLTDVRTVRIYNRGGNERLFDFDVTLRAPADKSVVFGDDKDGTMAIRIPETMRLTHKALPGAGHIVLSTGLRDEETWGKRADWCDYSGPVEGKVVGIAIFDHPENLRHPPWWHVRDYGLFAANPFGIHDFEKKPKGTGDFILRAGQSITFRYRFYMHKGDASQGRVAEHYKDYISR